MLLQFRLLILKEAVKALRIRLKFHQKKVPIDANTKYKMKMMLKAVNITPVLK